MLYNLDLNNYKQQKAIIEQLENGKQITKFIDFLLEIGEKQKKNEDSKVQILKTKIEKLTEETKKLKIVNDEKQSKQKNDDLENIKSNYENMINELKARDSLITVELKEQKLKENKLKKNEIDQLNARDSMITLDLNDYKSREFKYKNEIDDLRTTIKMKEEEDFKINPNDSNANTNMEILIRAKEQEIIKNKEKIKEYELQLSKLQNKLDNLTDNIGSYNEENYNQLLQENDNYLQQLEELKAKNERLEDINNDLVKKNEKLSSLKVKGKQNEMIEENSRVDNNELKKITI